MAKLKRLSRNMALACFGRAKIHSSVSENLFEPSWLWQLHRPARTSLRRRRRLCDEQIRAAGVVQGLARDLGSRGITINNVQPGPVNTELNPDNGEFAEMLKKVTALPRYGTVEEIAGMVAYLAGPEAAYVTGANLMIDGRFSA